MTSLSEGGVQRGLSLKHGGALFGIQDEDKFAALDDCELNIGEKSFSLTYLDGRFEEYPKMPSYVFLVGEGKVKKGTIIFMLPKLVTFSYVLDCVIKTCSALGRVAMQEVKNKIEFSRCMCLSEESKIEYDFENEFMYVDSTKFKLDNKSVYFHPNGAKVKLGQKFKSGVENIRALSGRLTYLELFYVFRSQFRHFMPTTAEEIVEVLYYLVTDKSGKFVGVNSTNLHSDSFFPRMGYGHAAKGLKAATKGEMFIKDDSYTSAIINPFLIKDIIKSINS